jgi:hypothetical protein
MRIEHETSSPPAIKRPGAFRAYSIASHLLALLVLVQAVLGGRGQFVDSDFIDLHEILANIVMLVVVAELVLVFVAGITGSLRTPMIVLNVLLAVLMIAQIGLGYAGRDNGEMAALHLPNGVLIFGLTVYNITLIARIRREGALA